MVRTRHALIAGSLAVLTAATLAFAGGFLTARSIDNMPVGTWLGALLNRSDAADTPAEVRAQFAVFWDVWSLIHQEFYHTAPLDDQQMVYGAIRGLLAALDDEYTSFQEPELAEQTRESMQGKFEGIGAYLRVENGELMIDRPIRNSPALRAGVQSGDVIVRIDGEDVAALIAGLDEGAAAAAAATRIRGPKGTVVTLTLRRDPDPALFDVAITRDEVPLITVNGEMLNDGVAYIQITEFKATTTELLDETLRELLPQQPRAIVLDLRDNPGGFLRTAQEVLGRFYDGVALYEEHSDGSTTELQTIAGPREVRVFDLPMVVLVNGNSASAAEIVAGALRDQRPNTTLMGETSFGKGSVQNIHQLRDGSSVRITIARWFTPARAAIHEVGITPQFVVPASADPQYLVPCVVDRQPSEGQDGCSDAQLAWSLRFLTTRATPPPPPVAPTPPA